MSIQGFPSSQKVPLGTGITSNFVTVTPIDPNRNALDVNKSAYRVGSNVTPRTAGGATGIENIDGQKLFWVADASTPARAGDFVRFETGAAKHIEIPIVKAETNRFLIAINSGLLPAAADTFYILRYTTPKVDENGDLSIAIAPAPIQFVKNGSSQTVIEDTVTPANNNPLPVKLTGVTGDIAITAQNLNVQLSDQGANPDVTRIGDGTNQLGITATNEAKVRAAQLPATLGQANMAGSTSVVLASDQSRVNVDPLVGVSDPLNSSTTPLAAGATFTGTAVDISQYAAISVGIATDVDSASAGFKMQFSPDGTNWDHIHSYDVVAPGVSYTQAAELRFFRILYTNGAAPQTYFRLTVTYKKTDVAVSRYTFDQTVLGGQFADNVKSVIYGKTTGGGGGYVAVKVNPSGALTTESTVTNTVAVTGPLTDAELRATAVPVSGPLTDAQLRATAVPVSGPLTDTQLRATAVPVSGPLTDTELRATAVPVSAASLPLPAGAATETTLSALNTKVVQDFGVSTAAVRVAAQLGNASGAAEFGAGASSAQTVRTVMASDQAPTSVAQSWFNRITDGTNTAAVKAASTTPIGTDTALVVALSPNSASQPGRSKVGQLFNDYAVTSVTTAAYTQLIASTSALVNKIEIFDSSGEAMILAVGGAGSEVDQLIIFPGGNGPVDLLIPSGSRISVKAKTATANSGFLAVNLYS